MAFAAGQCTQYFRRLLKWLFRAAKKAKINRSLFDGRKSGKIFLKFDALALSILSLRLRCSEAVKRILLFPIHDTYLASGMKSDPPTLSPQKAKPQKMYVSIPNA